MSEVAEVAGEKRRRTDVGTETGGPETAAATKAPTVVAFDPGAYLKRIGLTEPPPPTLEGLHTLQRAQALAIPFENFDVLLGRGISLEPEKVFDKLVHHKRGGYCFELNGLLERALQVFGFTVRALLGRVHLSGKPGGRTHQVALVTIEGERWVADAGFGGTTLLAPMRLVTDERQNVPGFVCRFIADPAYGFMYQQETPTAWANQYSFDLEHVVDADRELGNWWTSTNPKDFFTWARVCARQLPNGRVTLFDRKMTLRDGGTETVTVLEEGEPYLSALREHFGIELDAPYSAIKPLRSEGSETKL